MEKIRLYKKNSFLRYFSLAGIFILLLSSCNPTKYVPDGESLLNENEIIINKEAVSKADLLPYIKQNPNKRIFGSRFYLGLYNLSNINKEKWPHAWLRNIGEEPVIFDPFAAAKTKDQIKSYIESKGYFDGVVKDTVETVNKRSNVIYNVELLPPYSIRKLYFEIADTSIENLFYLDSVNCIIERGKPYDVDILQAERSRFERFIKDQGFYGFSGEHISFNVDSTIGNRQVDIYYNIRQFLNIDPAKGITSAAHSVYRVKNIYIYPDFVPKEALEGGEAYLANLDTTYYRGFYFVSTSKSPEVKYDLIIQSLYLKAGSAFNVTNTELSQSHLLSLKVYRLVNISYNERDDKILLPYSEKSLDCNIHLTPLSKQSYKVELEGTNSSGYIGGAVNLIYQNKNLFRGAELFSVKLKAAYEALSQQNNKLTSIQEYGLETSIKLPQFLLPFIEKESFIKKYNPTTNLLASYNYQALPYYTRTIANMTFGYLWRAGNYQEHILNPLQFNIVKLPVIDSAFAASIETSSYLVNSFKDVLILGGSYSFIFNNQKILRSRDYWFLRVNFDIAGNMLALAKNITNAEKKEDGSYYMFGLPFAQFVRTDLDLRYNYNLNDVSSVVYRGFIGVGIPYGNSKAVPFEKQYFGGGAYSLRGWQVRSLGPGSFKADTSATLLNQTADIKIELNAEYRFKLFWVMEGAVFLDAGNIWSYQYDEFREGSQFKFNKFYKDFAVGTGAGLRFDFSFFIGRVDLGMKLRDPSIADGSKWIARNNRPYNFRDDFSISIGIGYPF